jgi:hypothetical protein
MTGYDEFQRILAEMKAKIAEKENNLRDFDIFSNLFNVKFKND